jgi:hypothetical protein
MTKHWIAAVVSGVCFMAAACGCVSIDRSRDVRRSMENEGISVFDIEYIDLNRDGSQEAVVVYRWGAHGSGVRVIGWEHQAPRVLFERISSFPGARFLRIEGMPTIVFHEVARRADYLREGAYSLIYRWDGSSFVLCDEPKGGR